MKRQRPGTNTIEFHILPQTPNGKGTHTQQRWLEMSHDMTKPTKWLYAQRRLGSAWASAQSDQSSLCAYWVAKDPSCLHADSKDSDQTGRMPRLIWVFAGRTLILLVLSCRGSNKTTRAENQEDNSFPADGHQAILNRMNAKSKTNIKRTNIDN